jgi:hypothetical protein
MALAERLAPWLDQPQEFARLRRDGFGRGLVFSVDTGIAGNREQLTREVPWSFRGALGTFGRYRAGYVNASSLDNWQFGDDVSPGSTRHANLLRGATEYTMEVIFRSRNTGRSIHTFGQWGTGGGNKFLFQTTGAGLLWVAAEDAGSNRRRWDASGMITANRWHRIILAWRGGSAATMNLDGRDVTSSFSAVDTAATSVRNDVGYVRIASGGADQPDMDIAVARLWNYGFSANAVKRYAEQPSWASLYEPRRIMVPVVAGGGDVTPPSLSSPAGAGGLGVCSGTVSTNEGNGTLFAVATASATQPSIAQIKAGQDHTGAAALRAVSQAVTATGTQTIASGAITGGAGTRYWHFVHTDAAANDSARVSSAGFSVTAPLSVTLDALVDESGTPRASYTVDKVWAIRASDNTLVATWTAQTTNGSGVLPALSNAGLTAVPHVFVTWDDNETPNNAGAKTYTPA